MIRVTAYNEEVDISLQEKGFALIPSFLSPAQMAELQRFFTETLPSSGVDLPFFTTHWSSNEAYRKKVNDFVSGYIKSNLAQHFTGYKCLFGYFLFKKSSTQGGVYMHKDWTLIDEETFTGYTLWIPLVDTTHENGSLEVVPGSHLTDIKVRGSNISQDYPQVSEKDFRSLPVSAGDAIVFDHRLLHSSPPNFSQSDRLTVGLVIVPENAVSIHYFHLPDTGETKRFETGDDFLVKSFYDYQENKPNEYIMHLITTAESPQNIAP